MLTLRQRNAAWDLICEIQALGIQLKADTGNNRVLFRPKSAMPFDVHGRLLAHRRAVLVVLGGLEMPILPDTAPGTREPCRYCEACMWRNPMCWVCGKCWALWRPAAKVVVKVKEAGDGAA